MMMHALDEGGIHCLREAEYEEMLSSHSPGGNPQWYECEHPVDAIRCWVKDGGCLAAVKNVSMSVEMGSILKIPNVTFYVIRMLRPREECLASWKKAFPNGAPDGVPPTIVEREGVHLLDVEYLDVLDDPNLAMMMVADFLPGEFGFDPAAAASVVDPGLRSVCL